MKKILALLALVATSTVLADANLLCFKICRYDMDCMDRCLTFSSGPIAMNNNTQNVTMPDQDDDDSYSNSGNPDDTGSEFDGGSSNDSGSNTGSWEDYSGPAYY